jgi:DNA-binding MarR family transcriptional regulator
MASSEPLHPAEEELCRVFALMLQTLPRTLGDELQRDASISSPEYTALASLADHRDEGLGVTQLATLVGLSQSRMSRVVDSLAARGDITRCQGEDARSRRLEITEGGMARLAAAWPYRLASIRRHVINRLDAASVPLLTATFDALSGDRKSVEAKRSPPRQLGVARSDSRNVDKRVPGPGRSTVSQDLRPVFRHHE